MEKENTAVLTIKLGDEERALGVDLDIMKEEGPAYVRRALQDLYRAGLDYLYEEEYIERPHVIRLRRPNETDS